MNTERAYCYCGHNIVQATRATAKYLGWKLTRTPFNKCESCAIGKAKQSNLDDGERNPPKIIEELWGIDGTKLKKPLQKAVHIPSRNYMNIVVEDSTGAAFIGPDQKGIQ